jgi:hypothetical protein
LTSLSAEDKTRSRTRPGRAWQSSRSKIPRSKIPLSQPITALTARLEPVSRRSASQPLAVLTASKRAEAFKKQVATASFFSRVAVSNPSPPLPCRNLACLRGGRLRNGLRDVGVARPSSSRRQYPCRFAPLLLRFSRKFRPIWLGPAQQSTAGPSQRLSRSKFARQIEHGCHHALKAQVRSERTEQWKSLKY